MKAPKWHYLVLFLFQNALATPTNTLNQTIKNDLTSYTKISSRPLTFFHWSHRSKENLSEIGLIPPKSPLGPKIFRNHLNVFWNNDLHQNGFVGNGMYFATDPAITQDYGTRFGKTADDWVLIEVKVPPGMRILDIHSGGERFSDKTAKLLEQVGCGKNPVIQTLFLANPHCRKFLTDAFQKLDIESVNYKYVSSAADFGISVAEDPGAFILTGKRLPQRAQVTLFTKEIPIHDIESVERKFIKSFTVKTTLFKDGGRIIDPWLEIKPCSDEELLQWTKQNLYGYAGHVHELPFRAANCVNGLLNTLLVK